MSSPTAAPPPGARYRDYRPAGAARALFTCQAPEVVVSGPAGTGKSRACLEKLHLCALKYPGMRGLICRKTRTSLTQSALVTFDKEVQPHLDGVRWRAQVQEYRYPNGSVLVVGGLDKASKIMSSQYDLAYVQEAVELTEADWESLSTRLRNGRMPYQQLLADCNPDAPTHWLKLRADAGTVQMLESRHEHNPVLWDAAAGAWTAEGARYIARLDALTGVRRKRLRDGLWAAAEGLIYEGWDPAVHLLARLPLPADVDPATLDAAGVPRAWPRYWAVDFGYTHPFVCQWWAVDPYGRLYRYRELYRTQRLVEDHAADMLLASGAVWDAPAGIWRWPATAEPRPQAIICDHDAEGRATLTRKLGLRTVPAHKAVTAGIQAVASRLKVLPDGRPRLYLLRDALVARDPERVAAKRPCCTEEEIGGYVWQTAGGRQRGEEPVQEDDHGMDCLRYMVAHLDLTPRHSIRPR